MGSPAMFSHDTPLRLLAAAKVSAPAVLGLTIGDENDRTTWRLDFGPDATAEQRAAAVAAVQGFDLDAPAVPSSVKMWQAKTALAAVGKLDTATAAITASGNVALQLAWEYATDISRASASVAAIGAVLNMSSTEIDALFVAASVIEV